jgi:hypothetical protein
VARLRRPKLARWMLVWVTISKVLPVSQNEVRWLKMWSWNSSALRKPWAQVEQDAISRLRALGSGLSYVVVAVVNRYKVRARNARSVSA